MFELTPAILLPKLAILGIIFPKVKRLRLLPNLVRKITEDTYEWILIVLLYCDWFTISRLNYLKWICPSFHSGQMYTYSSF
jgi:hypothetical protein